ncbi:MAG: hypothetical protein CMI81_01510 [Candidatus Pelagibacter sp.]|nr:hypothetical protein [Candidatus Pelagibacter sp.]OUV98069.1 MAG: hypothetical protein CBD02_02125 [Candidatus Pelagibacter sp. TMED142]|tara:strand:- start:620 stop:1069 length:450 start_codon:yes stop_codon:yes gene_type:complete
MIKKDIIFFIILLFSFTIINPLFAEMKSLKNKKTNVRLGPDITYPIKWYYKSKYYPVKIIDKHYNWRKIRDFDSDTGWIHISQLSNKKTVITNRKNVLVFSKATIYSKPKHKLDQNISFVLERCKKKWCMVKNGKIRGWIKKSNLWGDF